MDKCHGGCLSHVDHDRNVADIDLMTPLTIRGLELRNRIVLSPMCQYSSIDGMADDWHLVHLGSRAVGGASVIFTEATAVTPQGRIAPGDLGIWDDKHIAPLERITQFIKRMGAIPAIQLAHAGRKGSCQAPWEGGAALSPQQGGWQVIGPSAIPFSEDSPTPKELDLQGIRQFIKDYCDATKRALQAGFSIIEIHAAHGYLFHEFLSPISNTRQDAYGGSLENRMRLLCEVAEAVRTIIPSDMPLFTRLSATDWVDGGWDADQSVELAKKLGMLGVDLIDVSSGGTVPRATIPIGAGYQVPLAEKIRSEAHIKTGSVGLITDPLQANEIVTSGKADLIFIGREFLREPYWALKAAQAIGQEAPWPIPYGYAVKRRK